MKKKQKHADSRQLIQAVAAVRRQEEERAHLNSGYIYGACVGLVLHDKFGFGRKRLEKARKEVMELFYAVIGGYLDIRDMEATLAEECEGFKWNTLPEK